MKQQTVMVNQQEIERLFRLAKMCVTRIAGQKLEGHFTLREFWQCIPLGVWQRACFMCSVLWCPLLWMIPQCIAQMHKSKQHTTTQLFILYRCILVPGSPCCDIQTPIDMNRWRWLCIVTSLKWCMCTDIVSRMHTACAQGIKFECMRHFIQAFMHLYLWVAWHSTRGSWALKYGSLFILYGCAWAINYHFIRLSHTLKLGTHCSFFFLQLEGWINERLTDSCIHTSDMDARIPLLCCYIQRVGAVRIHWSVEAAVGR